MKLSDIQSKAQMKPPRLLIYGGAGLGKTTFGATLPSPILCKWKTASALLRSTTSRAQKL